MEPFSMYFRGPHWGIKASTIAIASLFSSAVQAQQPAAKAVQPSAVFVKTAEATRSSFCKNARLLSCLQLDRVKCEAQIGPAVNNCTKDAGPAFLTTQAEGLVSGYLTGCLLSAFLPANAQRSKEATSCIQQAGKK